MSADNARNKTVFSPDMSGTKQIQEYQQSSLEKQKNPKNFFLAALIFFISLIFGMIVLWVYFLMEK